MDFGLVKDILLVGGFVLTLWKFSTDSRKQAGDVAAWRARTDAAVARLDERLNSHKADHESDSEKQEAFRRDAYKFMAETRDRLTRIEARGNGR